MQQRCGREPILSRLSLLPKRKGVVSQDWSRAKTTCLEPKLSLLRGMQLDAASTSVAHPSLRECLTCQCAKHDRHSRLAEKQRDILLNAVKPLVLTWTSG